ncbi:MAG: preprotein translocase subunit SecE [Patescibacteria group bacterium]|nr:preprotein translocase subunit SecE [Patescibacteria group bacterium]MDD5566985.1 preprotein translocase subunit SecE [Patescibacteria group bacterium]
MDIANNKIVRYLKDSRREMKRVVWPTRQETVRNTLLVIGISLGVAIFLGVLDFIFNIGLEKLLSRTI